LAADLQTWKGETMMKGKRVLACVVPILMVALMMPAGLACAKAVRVEFTGIEVPLGPPLEYGIWSELPSGNVHGRGMVSQSQEIASDPRMSGVNTVVMNANWGRDGAGPMWGTNRSQVPPSLNCEQGGVWEGSWTGMMNADGSYSYRAVGRGVSGCVEGLRFSLSAANPGGGQLTAYTGEILDPHGE
jgi:hypothetical protein